MEILKSPEDFKWYKRELDLIARYEHKHIGEPKRYPCKVKSEWEDNPNGPFTYYHTFTYQITKTCPHCGHTIKTWEED